MWLVFACRDAHDNSATAAATSSTPHATAQSAEPHALQ
jgi:hypothetical protein